MNILGAIMHLDIYTCLEKERKKEVKNKERNKKLVNML
jgi:hypothetical protein